MSEFELVTNTRIRPRAREWIIEFIYLKKKKLKNEAMKK